jgi:hypothetical protein
MNCPYCGEEINEHASHCSLCGADLTLILPLLAAVQSLTKRLEVLENGSGKARIADEAPTATLVQPMPPAPFLKIPSISDELAVALAFIGIALAHYAVVVIFDTKVEILLAASIVVPFCMGFLRRSVPGHSILRVIAGAIVLAFAALAEMSYVTWSLWDVPLLPQNAHDWHELANYGGSIALSFVAGTLARGLIKFWYIGRGRIRPRMKAGIVGRGLKYFGKVDPETLEKFEKVSRQLEYTLMSFSALVGTIYYLIDHLGQTLHWLEVAKPP